MRTLKITMVVAAIAFSSAICNAQTDNQFTNKNNKGEKHQNGDHAENHKKRIKLAKELGLNKETENKLKAIRKKHQKEISNIHEQMLPLKKDLKALNEINLKEKESILSPEQLIQLKEKNIEK